MGRYAFFNTEYEYKFAFGVQDSSDILLFGGEGEEGCHTWTQEDKTYILKNLMPINFEKYEKNVHGTYALEADISDHTQKLGCVIYHQLLYIDELTCEYES